MGGGAVRPDQGELSERVGGPFWWTYTVYHGPLPRATVLRPLKGTGGANPAAPAARNLGNHLGTGGMAPLVNHTFEWGVVIATSLSVLSVVPRRLCPFDLLPSPKIEGNGCGARYPEANCPSPAARAARSKREKRTATTHCQSETLLLICCAACRLHAHSTAPVEWFFSRGGGGDGKCVTTRSVVFGW